MVAILREAYAPTGEDAIFPNFRTLFSLEQGSTEELSTYMARIHTINGKLKDGGVYLPPILLNMFTVKGLGGAYAAVKTEFALTSSLFSVKFSGGNRPTVTMKLVDIDNICGEPKLGEVGFQFVNTFKGTGVLRVIIESVSRKRIFVYTCDDGGTHTYKEGFR